MGADNLQHTDFSTEQQAARLRDLARNGAADEATLYGSFPDGTSTTQSNRLSGDYTDLDSAALLESLADFNSSANDTRTPVPNDHFASLLQAAATAGGQEIARAKHRQAHQTSESESPVPSNVSEFFQRSFLPETRPKRKRNQIDDGNDDRDVGLVRTKRRERAPAPEDPDIIARQEEIWGPEENEDEHQNEDESIFMAHKPIPTADARAAGVHSAAALFRRPTAASKKYTRPPMSKLFLSLELDPEDFLRLQAAAKDYMLDPKHPERTDCVGSRGKGDTDVTKLKLFGCVKQFLEDGGWGERYFSLNAKKGDKRKVRWPENKNKIISLVTPLMRRMVTNERQRRYAVQTRNEKRKGNGAAGRNRDQSGDSEAPLEESPHRGNHKMQQIASPTPDPVDPNLDQYHYNPEPSFTSEIRDSLSKVPNDSSEIHSSDLQNHSEIQYHVNILQNGRRVKERYTLAQNSCPGFSSLVQFVHSIMDTSNHQIQDVKVLGPNGLAQVKDEEEWREIIALIGQNEWMDGEAKCLILLGDQP